MPKEMPKVMDCDMAECAFNDDKMCHAMAINIAPSSPCPLCGTFMTYGKKAGVMDMTGSVGACKVDNCRFNDSLECSAAEGIHVGRHENHPDCKTFAAR